MKKNHSIHAAVLALGVVLAACGSSAVQASSPDERLVCTTLPGQVWMGEEKIRAIFGASDYLRADFKVSKTKCYEFYAIKKNGDIVEAYYHPVTGALVKRNVLFHAQGAASAASPASAASAASPASLASAVSLVSVVIPASAAGTPAQAASGAHPASK